jgi:peptide/nickel transport system substrate-binding protein
MDVRRIARRWLAVPALFTAGALLVGACGSGSGSSGGSGSAGAGSGNRNGTVTVVAPQEPDSLDPQRTNAAVAGQILSYASDSLLSQDPSGKIVPSLATDWTASSDGLKWTFNLRHDVTFQNGDPMNADAVKASFDRAMNPATKPGAVAALLASVSAVKSTGQYQVEFDLKQAFSPFLVNLTAANAAVVDAAAAAKMGSQFDRAPVLTGAWQITSWQSGQSITLQRNDKWNWGPAYMHKGPPAVKTVIFRIITDIQTQSSALQNGEAQYTYSVPVTQIGKFQNSPDFNMVQFPRKGVGLYLEFNQSKAPFSDPLVRQAMSYAVDRKPIMQVALQGKGEVACGPLPPSIPGYWNGICNYGPKYDTGKAKQLLQQAGYKPDSGGKMAKDGQPLTFTVYYTAGIAGWDDSIQLLQQQFAKIGVTMNIQTFEFGTLLSKVSAGEDQAHLMGYTYTNADILYLLFDSKSTGGGINFSHVKDPQMDSLLEQYRSEPNAGKRNTILQDVQKRAIDDSIQVPIWNNTNYGLTAKKLQNVKLAFSGFLIMQNVTL